MNLKRVVIFGLIVIGIILGIVLIINFWAAMLFWGYCIIALGTFLVLLVSVRSKIRFSNLGTADTTLGISLAKISDNPLSAIRLGLVSFMDLLSFSLGWPAFWVESIASSQLTKQYDGSLTVFSAHQRLHPTMTRSLFITLMILLVIYISGILFVPYPHTYARAFLVIILLQIATRLFSSALSSVSLITLIRQSPVRVYIYFPLIAAATYIILLSAFSFHIAWGEARQPDLETIQNVSGDMLTLNKLRSVLTGGILSPIDYLVGVTGFLFSFTLFNVLRQYDQFRRKNDDFQTIGGLYLLIGEFSEGLSWLNKVKPETPATWTLKAVGYLGVNQLTDALSHNAKANPDERDPNDQFFMFAMAIFQYPVPKHSVIALVQEWLKLPSDDARFGTAMSTLLEARLIDVGTLESVLKKSDMLTKMPFTQSLLFIMTDKFSDARQLLEGIQTQDSFSAVAKTFLTLLCDIQIFSDDLDTQDAKETLGLSITHGLTQFDTLSVSPLNGVQKLLLVTWLNSIMLLVHEVMPERDQEMRFVYDKIKKRYDGTDSLQEYGPAIERVLKAKLQL